MRDPDRVEGTNKQNSITNTSQFHIEYSIGYKLEIEKIKVKITAHLGRRWCSACIF
jgi:hypothetical protein